MAAVYTRSKAVRARKHEVTVAVKESDTRWCSDGLELSFDNGERVRVAFALDCCEREIMAGLLLPKALTQDWLET